MKYQLSRPPESPRAQYIRLESRLTVMERKVLRLWMRNHDFKDIATALGMAVKTANGHVSKISNKLRAAGVDVHSRLDAIVWGLRSGVVGVEELKMRMEPVCSGGSSSSGSSSV